MRKSSLDDFVEALKSLDEKMDAHGYGTIEIHAIGGFAMMYYGFRKDGYTIDIDSLTERFDEDVVHLIEEVGCEKGIEEDWLNADCAMLEGFLNDLSEKINWKDTNYDFKHIVLKVADVPGLIRSKAKAVHDGGLVPRTTDKKDLISGLIYVGITNIDELNLSSDYAFIRDEYGRCYSYLEEIKKWQN